VSVKRREVGDVISGTLRLEKRIADGGMGSVWIAEHLVLGTEVAVKFLSPQWAPIPNAQTRFLREARLTARIESPHVVRALDCRRSEADEPYLVLELLRGENLEQRVRRTGALSVFEVVELVAQTCEALAATHEAGIVHRDVKPENVFVVAGTRPFVKLIDYGVAKPMRPEDCLDVDRLPAGTPQYMSPEHMFDPEKTDHRSDLFSLGAVAYFALTKRSPFDAETLEGLYFAIDGATFERPSTLRPELPPEIDAWFEKALAHDPEKRFASAREMAGALYDAVRNATGSRETLPDASDAPPPSVATLGEVRGLPRRNRSRLAFACGFALAAAAGFLAWHRGPDVKAADAKTSAPVTMPVTMEETTTAPALYGPPSPPRAPSKTRASQPPEPEQAEDTGEQDATEKTTSSIQDILLTVPRTELEP
jgi:serine/threonine-protein kinase